MSELVKPFMLLTVADWNNKGFINNMRETSKELSLMNATKSLPQETIALHLISSRT
jgi:hypothetical protein